MTFVGSEDGDMSQQISAITASEIRDYTKAPCSVPTPEELQITVVTGNLVATV